MKTLILTIGLLLTNVAPVPVASEPEAQAQAALQATMPDGLMVTDLRLVGPKDWSPQATLVVQWQRGLRPGRRRATLHVTDGARSFRSWASVRIAKVTTILVATRALRAGTRIGAKDIKWARRAVRNEAPLDIAPQALLGQTLLRDVEADAVLTEPDVVLAPALSRGTEVRVVSESNGVRIEVPGTLTVATRPGARGKVRVSTTARLLSGRLMSDQRFVLEGSR